MHDNYLRNSDPKIGAKSLESSDSELLESMGYNRYFLFGTQILDLDAAELYFIVVSVHSNWRKKCSLQKHLCFDWSDKLVFLHPVNSNLNKINWGKGIFEVLSRVLSWNLYLWLFYKNWHSGWKSPKSLILTTLQLVN